MRISAILVVSLLALTSVAAAQQSSTCALLTPADIEAATGTKPGPSQPGQMDAGAGKGGTVYTCIWPAGQTAQLMASMARIPPGMDVKAVAKNNVGMDALRAQHYTAEEKDFGNAFCSVMTPPAGKKDGMMLSSCASGAKGTLLSLSYMSQIKKLTLEQTKALLDKAVARLP